MDDTGLEDSDEDILKDDRVPSSKRKRNNNDDVDEDDEEDEEVEEEEDVSENEEEEEEDEEEVTATKTSAKHMQKKPKSKQKSQSKGRNRKNLVSSYFLTEAEDAGEDEDDEEEDTEIERHHVEVGEEEKRAAANVLRRQENQRKLNEKSAEEIAADVEARYRSQARQRVLYGDVEATETTEMMSNDVSQQSLLPSVNDPGIWMVKCKPGLEETLVRSVMLKAMYMRDKGVPFKIKTVFCSSKGYVYIEAIDEPFARDALQGLRGFYHSTFQRVPIQNMTALLSVNISKKPLRIGQLARMKRGPLKGDLLKVISLTEGGSRAVIQMMPRFDFNNPKYATTTTKEKGSATSGITRPPQRLFDAEEAKKAGLEVNRKKPSMISEWCDFCNNDYYLNGFLIKEVTVDTFIESNNIKPSLEELQLFRERKDRTNGLHDEDEDIHTDITSAMGSINSLMKDLAEVQQDHLSNLKNRIIPYRVGDLVQVTDGELKNLVGTVLSVHDASQLVKIQSLSGLTNMELEVEASLLMKHIRTGAHVKVVSGLYMGQTGRVVCVNMVDGDHIAAILTDGVLAEITCNIANLQVTEEVTTGLSNLMGYELYDLVAISQTETAIIIGVGADTLRVMNQQGAIKQIPPMEIIAKRSRQSMSSTALDATNQIIKVGDPIVVNDSGAGGSGGAGGDGGRTIKRSGTIKHIMKGTLWIHSTNWPKDSGIFTMRSRNCTFAGQKVKTDSLNSSLSASSTAGGAAGKGGHVSFSKMKKGRDDDIGKTVKIKKGAYKGLLGHIIDSTETHYSLELHTKLKKITIEKINTNIVGGKEGSLTGDGYTGSTGGDHLADSYSATPNHLGSQTPSHAPQTPSYYANTPSHDVDDFWDAPAAGSSTQGTSHSTTTATAMASDPLESEGGGWGEVDNTSTTTTTTTNNNNSISVHPATPSVSDTSSLGWGEAADASPISISVSPPARSPMSVSDNSYHRNNTNPYSPPPVHDNGNRGWGGADDNSGGSGWADGAAAGGNTASNYSPYSPITATANTGWGGSSSGGGGGGAASTNVSGLNRSAVPTATSSSGSGSGQGINGRHWPIGAVVCFKNRPLQGQLGVIHSPVNELGQLQVLKKDSQGMVDSTTSPVTCHSDEVALISPKKDDDIIVIEGREKGKTARVKTIKDKDVIISARELYKVHQVAVMHVQVEDTGGGW